MIAAYFLTLCQLTISSPPFSPLRLVRYTIAVFIYEPPRAESHCGHRRAGEHCTHKLPHLCEIRPTVSVPVSKKHNNVQARAEGKKKRRTIQYIA